MIITRKIHHTLALRLLHNITSLVIADMCTIDCNDCNTKIKFKCVQVCTIEIMCSCLLVADWYYSHCRPTSNTGVMIGVPLFSLRSNHQTVLWRDTKLMSYHTSENSCIYACMHYSQQDENTNSIIMQFLVSYILLYKLLKGLESVTLSEEK